MTSALLPVGWCSPKPARSSSDKKHELLQAFAEDREQHHEPRGKRSTPQQRLYRLRHELLQK